MSLKSMLLSTNALFFTSFAFYFWPYPQYLLPCCTVSSAVNHSLLSSYSPLNHSLLSSYCPLNHSLLSSYSPLNHSLLSSYCPLLLGLHPWEGQGKADLPSSASRQLAPPCGDSSQIHHLQQTYSKGDCGQDTARLYAMPKNPARSPIWRPQKTGAQGTCPSLLCHCIQQLIWSISKYSNIMSDLHPKEVTQNTDDVILTEWLVLDYDRFRLWCQSTFAIPDFYTIIVCRVFCTFLL